MTAGRLPNHIDSVALRTRWPLERVLFALAGSVILVSLPLAVLVSNWFLLLTAIVGVNQWLFVLFGACPASVALQRFFSLPSVVYPRREIQPAADGARRPPRARLMLRIRRATRTSIHHPSAGTH